MAESEDGASVLLGEATWAERPDGARLAQDIEDKARRFPHAGGRTIVTALWLPRRPAGRAPTPIVTVGDLVRALR